MGECEENMFPFGIQMECHPNANLKLWTEERRVLQNGEVECL
jgi:hypothetical protein